MQHVTGVMKSAELKKNFFGACVVILLVFQTESMLSLFSVRVERIASYFYF